MPSDALDAADSLGSADDSAGSLSAELSMESAPPPPTDEDATSIVDLLHRARRLLATEPSLVPFQRRADRLLKSADQPLILAVLGLPNAGKTTFINALIGRDVIAERTRVPQLLRYGRRPGGRIVYRDGRVETIRFQDLRGFLETHGVVLSPERVRMVEVLVPIEELTRASILNMPDHELRTEDDMLAEADAVLWLGNVEQESAGWRAAGRWLTRYQVDAMAVVTQTDAYTPEQTQAAIERARHILGGRVADVVGVSARLGLKSLRARDMDGIKQSGFARLHRRLRTHFFDRGGAIRTAAMRRRVRNLLALTHGAIDDRLEMIGARLAAVTHIDSVVKRDQDAFSADIERFASDLLERELDGVVMVAAREAADLAREAPGATGQDYMVGVLRARLHEACADAIASVRSQFDLRLALLMEGYFDAFEEIFGAADAAEQAQRIAGLRGILDAHRILLLEEVFGRFQAYLEGWIDQAPLHEAFSTEHNGQRRDTGALSTHLRKRILRLDQARIPEFEGASATLFVAFLEFARESAGELRVLRIDLGKRLLEPLGRLAKSPVLRAPPK
jgi:hypothetical protein